MSYSPSRKKSGRVSELFDDVHYNPPKTNKFGYYSYLLFAVCNYFLAVGTKSKGAPAGISGSVLILFEYSESIFPA